MPLISLTPEEVHAQLATGATLIDVREVDEFARGHIPGAVSRPLSRLDDAALPSDTLIFTCRSGARTSSQRDRLSAIAGRPAAVLAGGIMAWEAAGLPIERVRGAPLELMRQVQIAAGVLVLTGVLLGWLVTPGWFGLAALVGAGLTFAGVSGTCGLAHVLAAMPWNRSLAG